MAVSGSTRVYEVKSVKASLQKSNPPQISAEAEGTTRTGGWRNPRLEARIYIEPPADGIYEFVFVADKPYGNVTHAITPVSAKATVPAPPWAKGVRVIAETNKKESKF
jgi:hypothetical protein